MYKWVRGVLGFQKTPETTLKSLEWVPKSIRVIARTPCEDPLRAQVVYNAALGRDLSFELLLHFNLSGRPWALQGPIWDPKIDMGRKGRHLWGPMLAKRLFQRGFQNGVEKVIEKGS